MGTTMSVVSKTSESISVKITSIPGKFYPKRKIFWYSAYGGSEHGTQIIKRNITTATHTYDGLHPDTSYYLFADVYVLNNNGTLGGMLGTISLPNGTEKTDPEEAPPPPPPSYNYDNTSIVYTSHVKSIDVALNGLPTDCYDSNRVCHWSVDGKYKDSVTLGGGIRYGGECLLTGLSPKTSYTVSAIITVGGTDNQVASFSTTITTGDPYENTSIAYASHVKSIDVALSGLSTEYTDYDRTCHWHLNGKAVDSVSLSGGVSYGAEYTFTGLLPNTSYAVSAIITVGSIYNQVASFQTTASTSNPHSGAYISYTSHPRSIDVKVSGLSTEYTDGDRICNWHVNGSFKESVSLSGGVSSGGGCTLKGLNPSTSYTIMVKITDGPYPGGNELASISLQIRTEDPPPVSKWNWNTSNGNATAVATQAAYSAVANKGKTSDFSYLVWNDLVNKVREVQKVKGKSWVDTYTTQSSTLMSAQDKSLTAVRFNSLRLNIGSYYSTGISEVSTGDTVLGSYFTTLANCINNWIDAG